MFFFSPKDKSKGTYDVKSREYKLHHTASHLLSTEYIGATVVGVTKDRETTQSSPDNMSICPWMSRSLGEMPPPILKVPKRRLNDEISLISESAAWVLIPVCGVLAVWPRTSPLFLVCNQKELLSLLHRVDIEIQWHQNQQNTLKNKVVCKCMITLLWFLSTRDFQNCYFQDQNGLRGSLWTGSWKLLEFHYSVL